MYVDFLGMEFEVLNVIMFFVFTIFGLPFLYAFLHAKRNSKNAGNRGKTNRGGNDTENHINSSSHMYGGNMFGGDGDSGSSGGE